MGPFFVMMPTIFSPGKGLGFVSQGTPTKSPGTKLMLTPFAFHEPK
jgi:hypothetical protein